MLNFSANVGMLFRELDLPDRFQACRAAGFEAVEFPFPYTFDAGMLSNRIENAGLDLVLFDLPVDDWDSGGRGCAADPGAVKMFREGVERAHAYASILRPESITCIVGNRLPRVAHQEQWDVLVDNMRFACDRLAELDITLLVETFNRHDNPGFFIAEISEGMALFQDVDRANFKIQADTYHVQMTEGGLASINKKNILNIGHIQIGDVPGRHQPGTGNIDFDAFFKELERLAYKGYVGLEYIPLGSTREALEWLEKCAYWTMGRE